MNKTRVCEIQMTTKCTCHLYILPFIIFLFILWSYYSYIGFCVFVVKDLLEVCLYLVFYHILFILILWCFLSSVFTPNATVPAIYKLTDGEMDLVNKTNDVENRNLILEGICAKRGLEIQTNRRDSGIRYCIKCRHIKPDRAHHCSVCGVCVLKMDHHCPFINNCVGFSNQKIFILLHFYTLLYCLYILCTSAKYMNFFAHSSYLNVIVVCLVIVVLYGIFGVMLLYYNCQLMSTGETAIDNLQNIVMVVENSSYNLGCWRNFIEVFGENVLLWPFPVFSTLGTGCVFPLRIQNRNTNLSNV